MHRRRLAVVVLLGACTAGSDDAVPARETAQAISPFAGFCGHAITDEWRNMSIAQRSAGVSTIQFYARPYSPDGLPIDAVIGFSDQEAEAFSDLGPILRFNPDGMIDARNGGGYAADVAMPYRVNLFSDDHPVDYFVRMVIDMTAHRYSVFVREASGPEVQVASNYAFRTEQAQLARIGNVAGFRDGSRGSLFYCDGHVTPPQCTSSSATSGWATSAAYPEPTPQYIVEVDVVPQGSNIDAVVGLASGPPSSFADLAAAMRFNPDGVVDARDGGTYRAVQRVPYTPNRLYTFVFLVDLARGTYSAWLDDPGGNSSMVVGDKFAFRTEQAGAPALGTIGQKIDDGAAKSCDVVVWRF